MLYHPFKDSNHCSYRLLSLLVAINKPIAIEKLRVIDFYYLFPFFIKTIQPWPSDILAYKKYTNEIEAPFESLPNKAKLFFDVNQLQNQSIYYLASKGIISVAALQDGNAMLIDGKIPHEILEIIGEDYFCNSNVFKILAEAIPLTKWSGASGLKRRSGLMEYKYDE